MYVCICRVDSPDDSMLLGEVVEEMADVDTNEKTIEDVDVVETDEKADEDVDERADEAVDVMESAEMADEDVNAMDSEERCEEAEFGIGAMDEMVMMERDDMSETVEIDGVDVELGVETVEDVGVFKPHEADVSARVCATVQEPTAILQPFVAK